MPSRPLGNDTITILEPVVSIDARDNTTYWTYTPVATVSGCSFQAYLMTEKFQEEFTVERESTRTFFRIFAPAIPVVEAISYNHQILFEGTTYEVHALPGHWKHFSGAKNHVAFLVKRRL